ncbi:geranylgeranyl transferas-like protein type i beta subunit [Delitschia confertaspora ATCC 74209]|uniref:Geranylgeranyl transferas-like protein type i beta subunit n=1 Tax=Delitschia confertaspora ATCC 74209 TaxID=1513339 RepID=A0A9P4JLY8_9PLEO|nr:geranylgeranyl transferas-like protein type i beta subunit [Delitschia confertaspora ATCC 74209]
MSTLGLEEMKLNIPKHIKYWRRSLKTFLPHHYTGNDSNRMTLAFFVLSALDLLGDLDDALTPEERQGHIEWVYRCQLPEGGFRAFPGADFGSLRNESNKVWDPASVPATFFALLVLSLLKDDLQRVKRREILEWLRSMQRPDGSFGETVGEGGRVEGGSDTRFGYMSAGIRWVLRGHVEGPVDGIEDIDVDKFIACVRGSETYDGGISDAEFHEAHAGFTCCAINALHLLDRLPLDPRTSQKDEGRLRGVSNLPLTLHWLTSRQTLTLTEDDFFDTYGDETDSTATCHDSHSFIKLRSYPSARGHNSFIERPIPDFNLKYVGFNGRCNKIADTCYAYWVCSPLKLLNHLELIDLEPIRRWLLEKMQHMVGGFGKHAGDPPDIYHSYLGLAVLAMFEEPGLKGFDAALCMSNDAKRHIEELEWRSAIWGV